MKQIALLIFLACSFSHAQNQSRELSTNVPGAPYPRLNADSSVTFRMQADQAQRVQLLMDLGQAPYDMVKGDGGFWEVTSKPLLPGLHYYLVSVDGFYSTDPGSRAYFAARKEVSAIEVPTPESEFFAARNVPHGAVRAEWYFSKATGDWRRTYVYTFPGYDRTSDRYPVYISSTDGARTRLAGARRAMKISFSTI